MFARARQLWYSDDNFLLAEWKNLAKFVDSYRYSLLDILHSRSTKRGSSSRQLARIITEEIYEKEASSKRT